MLEFAKKGFFIGLGLASMTKDKAEAFAKEFAKSAKMTEDEGRKFAEYISGESKKAQKNLKETIENMVAKATSRMATRKQLEELQTRIEHLEELVKACCAQQTSTKNENTQTEQSDS